jgi:membrane-bound lytic murein transglycosylase MltF
MTTRLLPADPWIASASLAFLALIFAPAKIATAQAPIHESAPDMDGPAVVERTLERITDDLDGLRKRGSVRVLVSFSRTNFFVSQGRPRGFDYDLLSEYQADLQAQFGNGKRTMTVVFVPVPFKDLIPALLEGRGDIAAGGLTITPERQRLVAFAKPHLSDVDEIVVTSKSVENLRTLDDLAAREVRVVSGSSYVQHLRELNDDLQRRGKTPVRIVEAAQSIEAEDLLEMVNAGVIPLTVVDKHVAQAWQQVLPDIVLREDIAVHRDGDIALAVRPANPGLLKDVNDFISKHRKGTTVGNIVFKRYFEQTKWLLNPVTAERQRKLDQLRGYFEKYASEFGFDWPLLAAQGFQESGLDQSMKSSAGAVGIMQLLPSTARDMDCDDISNPQDNIHAGAKYMAWLRDTYFDEPDLPAVVKLDFTLAAYNAGAGNVKKWRNLARSRGLDPNLWRGNVERIALEMVGEETYRYVRNINKYYVAYKESLALVENRKAEVRQLTGQ